VTTDLDVAMDQFQTCIEQRDHTAADGILDADYALVTVQPTRAVMPRKGWLEVLDDYVVHSYEVTERLLDVDGDVAVAIHRAEMSATVLGKDRSGTFVITDVWRCQDGQWKVWRRHSTALTAGPLPGA
jgi:ketosteroid isomerase-like protein